MPNSDKYSLNLRDTVWSGFSALQQINACSELVPR